MIGFQEVDFGLIPENWSLSTIEEETEFVTDYVANGSFASLAENVTYKHSPDYAILIRLTDYNNEFNGPFVYVDKHSYDFLKKSKLKGGEIIISNVGAYTGTIFRAPILDRPTTLGPNAVMLNFKNGNTFYEYWLKSNPGQYMIGGIISGSAQPKFNKTSFRKMQIPVPPVPEQEAIAEVLSSLDDKIDLLHRQNKTLEQMAETLFRKWFIEDAKEEWEMLKVKDIAIHKKDSVNPSKNPFVEYKHYSLPAFDSGKRPQIELGSTIHSNKYRVHKNSILVSKLNPRIPRIWLNLNNVDDKCICSTEFQVIKPKETEYLGFLFCLLKSDDAIAELEMSASGTSGSHQRVRPEDILNLGFNTPSINRIIEFSKLVKPLLAKTVTNQSSINILEQQRDTLLPKLMSGEVRIKMD